MDNTELRPLNICDEYFASTDGYIWRLMKNRPRHKNKLNQVYKEFIPGKWFILVKGYLRGKYKNYLAIDIKDKTYAIHRLVAQTFIPQLDNTKLLINHKDRNTLNNNINNLEWCTNQENCIHAANTPKSDFKINYQEYLNNIQQKYNTSEVYTPKSIGGQLQYNVEAIKYELANNSTSMKQIANKLGCSFRSVKYWQEKLKINRPKKNGKVQRLSSNGVGNSIPEAQDTLILSEDIV